MKISEDLKKAISQLPVKEKDKLIFRLLKRDETLASRLLFELVSDSTVEEKRAEVKRTLTTKIEQASSHFYSCGYLNMDVRSMSGDINEHVSITKDKFGEIQLNLYLLNSILSKNRENILSGPIHRAEKFCVAVVARVFKIMLLIDKMHEDYFIEFRDDVEELGKIISNNPYLMKFAIANGLDVNWLIAAAIPEDIVSIYKYVRANGML